MLFIFFIVIILGASFFGFGNIFQWPKQFSICKDGSYYFTVQLELSGTGGSADQACFNTSGAQAFCQTLQDTCRGACAGAPACLLTCGDAYGQCVENVNNN
jgi:hypothetical protein